MNRETIERINVLLAKQEKFNEVSNVPEEVREFVRLDFYRGVSPISFYLDWDEAISILKQKAVACEKELKELGFEEDEE